MRVTGSLIDDRKRFSTEAEEEEEEEGGGVPKPTTPCFATIEGVTNTTSVTVLVANTTFKSTLPTNPSVLKVASSSVRACPLCSSVRYRHIIPELFSSARLRVRIVLLGEKLPVQVIEPEVNVIVMLFELGLELGRLVGRAEVVNSLAVMKLLVFEGVAFVCMLISNGRVPVVVVLHQVDAFPIPLNIEL